MVVRGCQRCFLKQSVIQGDHFHQKHYGWFRILAEDCLPPPLSLIIPSEWRNIPARTPNFLQAAYLTRLPPPFYATTDPELLMKSITEEIKTWQLSGDFPSQATEFSYWVSSNLPMPVTVRLQLLGAASTTHRLRACLMMLRGFNRLLCTGIVHLVIMEVLSSIDPCSHHLCEIFARVHSVKAQMNALPDLNALPEINALGVRKFEKYWGVDKRSESR